MHSSSRLQHNSGEKSYIEEALPEEKPIVGNQMTFEQLLETKLQ
jgi:hypothetical protein